MKKKQIVVIGDSDSSNFSKEAYQIGKYIAINNFVLITGGRSGIMEAVSKGASDADGIVIGILPGNNTEEANKYCNIIIPTGIGFARNIINILAADLVIAIGGKSGTLSELAYAWQFEKPIICCTFALGWSNKFAQSKIDDRTGSIIYNAENVEDVFKYIDNFFN